MSDQLSEKDYVDRLEIERRALAEHGVSDYAKVLGLITSEPTPQQVRAAGWVLLALNKQRGEQPGRTWSVYELMDEATAREDL